MTVCLYFACKHYYYHLVPSELINIDIDTVVIDMTELMAADGVVFYDILKATMRACKSLTNLDVNEVESLWFQPPMPQSAPYYHWLNLSRPRGQ